MKLSAKFLLVLIALLAGACGAGGSAQGAKAPASLPGYGAPESAAAETSYGAQPSPQSAGYGDASASKSAPSGGAAPSSPGYQEEQAQRERPGLGTVWGEDRVSHVRTAPFFRVDPERPFSTVGVYYNDATGVAAMAERSGRSDYGDNVFPTWHRSLTVSLLDEGRRPLPSVRAGGRVYVVGEHGQRYLIQVRNHSPNRVEIVASVDGLDVIDGRPANYRKRGYILAPYGTLEIEGFRRSEDAVASFRFGSVRDSYAERKGEGRNIGVIGVAFFAEQGSNWEWTDEEVQRRHDADPFPARYADPPPAN